ncbi:MAG: hypothetical protein HYR75_01970 [Gemmatimonadetes bacterium]|nr:hypothetical protein [Gemmatimonadota bacterium]
MAIQSDLSPANLKLRTFSNSRFVPLARSTTASLAGVAGAAPFAAPPGPAPPARAPRPPRPPVFALAYSMNATHLLFPAIARLGAPAGPPRPPAVAGGLPTGKRHSLPSALVGRITTSASPSLGARTYANHRPSFDSAGVRIDFQPRRSLSVSWRPAEAGGVHFETGLSLAAP